MKYSNLHDLEGMTAILGGSFDPVHLGHLHIAQQVLFWTRVQSVLFVPNGNHHFKQDKVCLSYPDRYSLLKAAIAKQPRMAISPADKSGTGFTSHLMQKLMADNPGTRYGFIIGSDNLANLENWHDFPWLAKHVHFIVLPRPGYQVELPLLSKLRVSLLPIELCPISSTQIKERIAKGKSIRDLVPEHLEQKILELYHNLAPETDTEDVS